MPVRDLEAVFYVSTVPIIEFRDGIFHIAYEIGKCRFEFAMPPNVFLKAYRSAGRVVDGFHAGKANVIAFAPERIAEH